MPWIYHEKQDAGLCGVHCLNNLLQGPFYSEVDLARIAHELDENERALMSEMGTDSTDFLKYMAEESGNVADDGNYSVQVLGHALEKVWNLHLNSITNAENRSILANPLQRDAFVCNLQSHWFAIRKIEGKWYNLNSLNDHPEILGDFYLGVFLKQLEIEGYSIFVVNGSFPPPQKDMISGQPYEQLNWEFVNDSTSSKPRVPARDDEDDELRRALQLSLQEVGSGASRDNHSTRAVPVAAEPIASLSDEELLELAIQESLKQDNASSPAEPAESKAPAYEVPPEPSAETASDLVTKVVLRLPSGARIERRFLRTDKLSAIYSWLAVNGIDSATHNVGTSFPKKELTEMEQTLAQLQLVPSAVLSVSKK